MDSILIVETDAATLDVLEKALEEYEVYHAGNRFTVMTQLNQKPPDLILVDLDLKEIDETWVSRIRRHRSYQNLPILLISEEMEKSAITSKLRLSGANGLIFKPIVPEALKSKVRALLDTSARANQRRAPRYAVQWRVDYHRLRSSDVLKPQGHQTVVVNVSEGGIAIVLASVEVKAKELYAFATYVPGHNLPVLTIGRICWVRPVKEKHIAGVQWVFWESEDEKQLVLDTAQSFDSLHS